MMYNELTYSELLRLSMKLKRGWTRARSVSGGISSSGGYYPGTIDDCRQAYKQVREEIKQRGDRG